MKFIPLDCAFYNNNEKLIRWTDKGSNRNISDKKIFVYHLILLWLNPLKIRDDWEGW